MAIDPRIRARRVAVKRAEGRKRLRWVLVGLAVVSGIGGGWFVTRSALLDVDHFQINGLSQHSESTVTNAAAIDLGTPLLDVDLGSIDTRVEDLPWVKSAHSARQWPGTVRIDVVERVPTAMVPAGEGFYALIDESGVVIAKSEVGSAPDLPIIDLQLTTSLGEIDEASLSGLQVAAQMPADLRPWVQRITVDPESGRLGLDLVGSAAADLGDQSLLSDKLESLRAVLAGADLTCVATIDVSVADLPTIQRDPVCEQSDPAAVDTVAGA